MKLLQSSIVSTETRAANVEEGLQYEGTKAAVAESICLPPALIMAQSRESLEGQLMAHVSQGAY
jgi:hypothetical protein